MAESGVIVPELENRFRLPQGSLDEACTDEHIKEIALLLDSWELLASHLGLNTQQIDAIKEENRSQEVKRKNALTKWKETFDYNATYRKLVEKLVKINRADLAGKVCKLLTPEQGLQQTNSAEDYSPLPGSKNFDSKQPSQSTSPTPRLQVVPLSVSPHQETVPGTLLSCEPLDPGAEFTTIAEAEKAFRKVVIRVVRCFEGKVPIADLQEYICHLPVDLKGQFGQLFEGKSSRIRNTETVGELFTVVSYFWDYLHPDLLRYLVDELEIKETVDLMSGYENELSKFRKKVKIPDYIGERRINLVEDDYTPIIAILGDEWCEKTLADLEEVRCDFSKKFSFLRLLPRMNGLKYNSIALIFSVPKSVQFDNDELCEFFRSYNVLKLTVGEECIYDDGYQQDQISGSDDQASADVMPVEEGEEEVVAAKGGKERSDDVNSDSDDQDIDAKESREPGGFTCEFIQKPPKLIQSECPVCLQVLREPYQVTCCGNSFCRVCIELLETDNKHCPTCKKESIICYPNKGLQRALYDFEVYCTHRAKGCKWTGELRQLEKHLNEEPQVDRELEGCLFTCVDCKFKSVGCEVKPARKDIPTHLKDHSEIHLELLQRSKSPLDTAFLEAQEQNATLSQEVIGVSRTVAEIQETHERELSQLTKTKDEIILKREREISWLHSITTHKQQQLLEMEARARRVAKIQETHERELLQQTRTTEQKQQQLLEMEAQYQQLLSDMMDQNQQDLSTIVQQHEQEVASLNSTLRRLTEEYERLQNQVHSQPPPPLSPSQASVVETPGPVLGIGGGTPTPPVTFTLTNYDANKRDDLWWWSPPFYIHHHGYKMCLRVYPNGHPNTEEHGTHVSVYIYLKKGEFDDGLKWPFRGDITVSLLDQEDNKGHYSRTIPFNDDTPDNIAGRVTEGLRAERGRGYHFIPHNDLQPKYLKNDCLVFQITNVIIQ